MNVDVEKPWSKPWVARYDTIHLPNGVIYVPKGLERLRSFEELCELACFISAAPELLGALQDAVRIMRKWTGLPDTSPIIQRLETVIAKATGEE